MRGAHCEVPQRREGDASAAFYGVPGPGLNAESNENRSVSSPPNFTLMADALPLRCNKIGIKRIESIDAKCKVSSPQNLNRPPSTELNHHPSRGQNRPL